MNGRREFSAIVSLQNVTKIFGTNEHRTVAVHQVSLQASQGEMILLLGPSGSGKTTLLTLMAGLIRPSSGIVYLFGKELESYTDSYLQSLRARQIGFVFQTFLLIDSLNVRENVEIVAGFTRRSKKERHEISRRLLEQFQVEHLSHKFPPQLSQGEKQRVALARAMANDAKLIIADEPTGSLESKQGFDVIRLLHTYAKENNKCVIVASHDLRLAEYADRILRLEDGRLSKPPESD